MKLTMKAISVTTIEGSKPFDMVHFSIHKDGKECGSANMNAAVGAYKTGDIFEVSPEKSTKGASQD